MGWFTDPKPRVETNRLLLILFIDSFIVAGYNNRITYLGYEISRFICFSHIRVFFDRRENFSEGNNIGLVMEGQSNSINDFFVSSLEHWYQCQMPKLIKYIRSRVNDPVIAEDIVSSILLRALMKNTQYDRNKGKFEDWIWGITKNTLKNYFCSSRGQQDVSLEVCNLEAMPFDNIEEGIDKKEQFEELTDHYNNLSTNEKSVLSLRYLKGRSYAEVAESMGITRGHVGVLLHRARNKLREVLLHNNQRGSGT